MTVNDAVKYVLAQLKVKSNTFSVALDRPSVALGQTILSACFNVSADPFEGDYIYFNLANIEIHADASKIYYGITYYCTAVEEDAAKAAIATGYPTSMALEEAFDSLAEGCVYDKTTRSATGYHWDGSTFTTTIGRNSIYDVFVQKKAVCQGFSNAMFVLAKQRGIDCRIVQGHEVNAQYKLYTHCWNIADLNSGKYGNLCLTSEVHKRHDDFPGVSGDWYNKSDAEFNKNAVKYARLPRFMIAEFNNAYPMVE